MVTRRPGIHFPEEILERILHRGMVLDGMSQLVALASNQVESLRATTPGRLDDGDRVA